MKITEVKIEDLKPATYNPRKWDKETESQLKESIKRFGMVDPIIANEADKRKNIVIGGHFRLKIAKDLGFKTVPVAYVNLPEIEKEQELNLRLNKNQGQWDMDLLAKLETSMLEDVGFENTTLDAIASDEMDEDKYELDEQEVKEIPPRAKQGELYQLGDHRLLCGDSTKKEDVDRLMDGNQADMVFTDPPYNVAYKSRGKLGSIKNDDMDEEKFIDFCEKFTARMKDASRVGACFYICSGYSSYSAFLYALRTNGFTFSTPIIWVKDTTSMGWNDYRHKHEMIVKTKNPPKKPKKQATPILYGWNGGKHYFAESRFEADVWEIKRRASNTMIHPTQKPLELVRRAILNSTKRDESVLDLFTGGGSTLIACEQTGRKAFSMELDPKFVDRIIARWEKLTGQKAVKLK